MEGGRNLTQQPLQLEEFKSSPRDAARTIYEQIDLWPGVMLVRFPWSSSPEIPKAGLQDTLDQYTIVDGFIDKCDSSNRSPQNGRLQFLSRSLFRTCWSKACCQRFKLYDTD
ncbi:hypothetical protein RRG08_064518 [Elysia crispata]|uniref:Uncharacterized protein n=1 Tax=Elysia crispata TaxID=231223 RepID=A0AAE1CU66_9GAST|nr:hypothetical protein RRG08_064518 [Elysia crispata]